MTSQTQNGSARGCFRDFQTSIKKNYKKKGYKLEHEYIAKLLTAYRLFQVKSICLDFFLQTRP